MTWIKKYQLLRWGVHLGGLLPLALLGWGYVTHQLTVNPIQAIQQRTGDLALIFLLLTLACTPAAVYLGWSQLLPRRRALGLYAFLYASVHALNYLVLDYALDWEWIWQSLVEKPYIVAGTLAFACLLPLALTSSRWAVRRLGGRNWKKLHRLIYPAALLVVLHFGWGVKGDFFHLTGDIQRPLAAGVICLILLGLRLPALYKYCCSPHPQPRPSRGGEQRRPGD